MKTLYYLARTENLARFDDLFEKEDVLATSFDAAKILSLTNFVKQERAIAQQDYIVIDVGDLTSWSRGHVLSAVQYLRRLANTKLIFIGEPCEAVTDLFRILADVHHVDDLITAAPGANVDRELADCLSPENGFTDKLEAAQKILLHETPEKAPELTIPHGLILHVAAAGTMARCGVTTQAFAINHYLRSLGFRPIISDPTSRILPQLVKYEPGAKVENDVTMIHGVAFCIKEQPGFNAVIVDYGVLSPENAAGFCSADLSVLIGCTKPWELVAFADALRLLLPYSCSHLVTLASFSTDRELGLLTKFFGQNNGLAPYAPDLWALPNDYKTYSDLLLPEVKRVCGADRRVERGIEAER